MLPSVNNIYYNYNSCLHNKCEKRYLLVWNCRFAGDAGECGKILSTSV